MPTLLQIKTAQKKINALDFDIILAHALGRDKEFLYTHHEYGPTLKERLRLFCYTYIYGGGTPVAYIIGHKEFYGLDFLVDKNTLIPRPDTVVMVDEAIKEISKFKVQSSNQIQNPNTQKTNHILLIDVGTGTGCIPISIIKTLKQESIKAIAIDISKKALRIAEKNAKKHGVNIKFLHGNLLEPIINDCGLRTADYSRRITDNKRVADCGLSAVSCSPIIITANLPYLAKKWYDSEPSIWPEPKTALLGGGKDGLNLYEKLLNQINTALTIKQFNPASTGSRSRDNLTILLEIDPRQSESMRALVQKYLPDFSVEIKKDLAGRDRIIKISRI